MSEQDSALDVLLELDVAELLRTDEYIVVVVVVITAAACRKVSKRCFCQRHNSPAALVKVKSMQSTARRVVVFGGTGYVGSAVAQALVRATTGVGAVYAGRTDAASESAPPTASSSALASSTTSSSDPTIEIVCASRSGRAPAWAAESDWAKRVTWTRCDALNAQNCEEVTLGATAVVTSIGALPFPWVSAERIVEANGDTNIVPGRAAMKNGVKRLVVVGATIPPLVPGLGAYARGKANVEDFARDEFAEAESKRSAIVLKPAAVSGTRKLGGGFSVPLSVFMDPARFTMQCVGSASLMEHAPVPLENLANAAARAALDEAYGDVGFTVISNKALIEDFKP